MRRVHDTAQKGFAKSGALYDRSRPAYAPAALEHILSLVPRGGHVVDVGAGTGKFSKALATYGAHRITAVEPVAGMRETLRATMGDGNSLTVVDGSAEQMPLDDNAADAIVCAQAFHWFATAEALREFHRVLRPEGKLVLIWNTFDDSHAWLKALEDLRSSLYDASVPRQQTQQWRSVFPSPLFHDLHEWTGYYCQPASHDLVADRIMSSSAVAAADQETQAALRASVLAVLMADPDTKDHVHDLEIPYETLIASTEPRK